MAEGEVFAWGYSRVLDGASLVRFCGQKKLASVSHTYSILILMINRVKDTVDMAEALLLMPLTLIFIFNIKFTDL